MNGYGERRRKDTSQRPTLRRIRSTTKYEFGEVVLVDFPQSGSVQKRRPALVILDIGDADVVLAPITTRERSTRGDYKLRDWQLVGLLRESWVRLTKIACLERTILHVD